MLNLAPLAGRGRRAFRAAGEGDSPRANPVESPPHPDPLPASGEREKGAASAAAAIMHNK